MDVPDRAAQGSEGQAAGAARRAALIAGPTASGKSALALRMATETGAIIVNADAWKTKKDAILRFVKAYRETVDWMYADPKAIAMYAQKVKADENLLKDSIAEFHKKEAMQTDRMADLDGAVADAVKLKFLDAPMTKEQLAEFLQIPPR